MKNTSFHKLNDIKSLIESYRLHAAQVSLN